MEKWLEDHGVVFEFGTKVTDADFMEQGDTRRITALHCTRDGRGLTHSLSPNDYAFIDNKGDYVDKPMALASGQYVEIPEDVVFTVEYSVRGAMHAVYGLLGLKNEIPEIYHVLADPKVAMASLKTLMG